MITLPIFNTIGIIFYYVVFLNFFTHFLNTYIFLLFLLINRIAWLLNLFILSKCRLFGSFLLFFLILKFKIFFRVAWAIFELECWVLLIFVIFVKDLLFWECFILGSVFLLCLAHLVSKIKLILYYVIIIHGLHFDLNRNLKLYAFILLPTSNHFFHFLFRYLPIFFIGVRGLQIVGRFLKLLLFKLFQRNYLLIDIFGLAITNIQSSLLKM